MSVKSLPKANPSGYAADTPVTRGQRTMRLAHMASYVHEDAGHSFDHLKSAMRNLKKGNSKAAQYDMTHALPHAKNAHAHSAKMVEQTHTGHGFATGRSQRSMTLNAMKSKA